MTTLRVRVLRPAHPDLARCHALRREVFIEEQRVPAEIEVDGRDPDCVHFLASGGDGGDLGAARLRVTPDGVAKAERVAVRAAARGLGVGRALMRALEAEAREAGHQEVVLGAQAGAIAFYLRLGYAPVGPRFMEADIEHQMMRLPLGADAG
jgi:predicted GNAT family N-acyltransferase